MILDTKKSFQPGASIQNDLYDDQTSKPFDQDILNSEYGKWKLRRLKYMEKQIEQLKKSWMKKLVI